MTFGEMIDVIGNADLHERRAFREGFAEVVVRRDILAGLTAVLMEYFGSPAKPSGVLPSDQHKMLSEPYGGIMPDQTMYVRSGSAVPELAMLWPWSSGMLVTIKIVQQIVPGRCLTRNLQ